MHVYRWGFSPNGHTQAFTKILWTRVKHANVQASFYDSGDCELAAQRPHQFQG